MIRPPERSGARDAALEALAPRAGELGWSRAALRQAAGPDADLLFPGGTGDVLEAYFDLADRRMAENAQLEGLGLTKRVRALIAARLAWAEPHKPGLRRAAFWLALPRNTPLAARSAARTVDAIWHAAGDRSADWSWYSKRAILAGVMGSVSLHFLAPGSTLDSTLAFLDRRLEDVARIGKLRQRFTSRNAQPRA